MVLIGGIDGVEIPGAEVRNRRTDGVSLRYVTPQFFSALGIPLRQGRAVEEGDRLGRSPVAVVSESFVLRYSRSPRSRSSFTGIGIHSLLAFMVAQRSREIGVRLALGAEPARVARMIVGEAARLALFGGIPGVLVAYAAARAMSALLFGIPPGDPVTLTSGALIVILATLAGSLAPASRAVRVSPLVACGRSRLASGVNRWCASSATAHHGRQATSSDRSVENHPTSRAGKGALVGAYRTSAAAQLAVSGPSGQEAGYARGWIVTADRCERCREVDLAESSGIASVLLIRKGTTSVRLAPVRSGKLIARASLIRMALLLRTLIARAVPSRPPWAMYAQMPLTSPRFAARPFAVRRTATRRTVRPPPPGR